MPVNDQKYLMYASYDTVNEIRHAVDNINNTISAESGEEILTNLDKNQLGNLLFLAEKIALSCRKSLEKSEKTDDDFVKNNYVLPEISTDNQTKNDSFLIEKLRKSNPVSVSFDGKKLKIFTPLTFKRFYRKNNLQENYLLMLYIRAALIDWQKENSFDLFESIEHPLVISIIRKTHKWNPKKLCDNDNLENGRIVNEIVEALGYSDNPMIVSLYSEVRIIRKTEPEGMEFVVCSKDDFSF